ncbi:MAG: choice-of-anchor Q domain-containing protein [Bacteroidia bacterium]
MYLSGGTTIITITNCTFCGNHASLSGGALYANAPPQVTLYINNSILAGNSSLISGPDGFGYINSTYGHNIYQSTTGAIISGVTTGNVYGANAASVMNTTLANNGGPTRTLALIAGSPAIDAADPVIAPPLDQRNYPRIGIPDIGAYEINLSPLPVQLISFTATPDSKNNSVNCKWTTASENNNNFFTLEKSADGKSFQILTQIFATNSSSYHNYNFIDENPFGGISYYRLSQTDYNGSTQMLKTVSVNLKNKNSFSVECYPNVGNGEMTINSSTPFTTIKVIDVDGKLLRNIFYPSGTQSVFIDLSDLKRGMYFIQAFSEDESAFEKIVIR